MNRDLKLLKDCQKGKPKAQRMLYEKYKQEMINLCMRYADSRASAEDIFQDSFVKVFKNIQNVKEPGSLYFWIRKVVIHTAINHYHKEKNRLFHEDINELNEQLKEEDQDIISQLNAEEVLRMVNELPDGYRIVFNLYVVDGFKHHEIADMLGVTESTSKTQLRKARLLLQKKIQTSNQIKCAV
ncbi:MAG: RNA polymerase sigma factor [bacterium]|nr:RNA polymerase sigma factor [bacterium]